jgi:hypothetical protein
MPSPSKLACWEGLILIGGLVAVVFWKLMNGGINMDSLLDGDRLNQSGSGFDTSFSPGRGQMLMVTILTAVYYLLQVIHNPREFPQIPAAWVAVLGGSHAMYLVGKAKSMLIGSVRDRIQDLFDRRAS